MGVLDKIKNALFEVEYVEVDEKPSKVKKEKPKKEIKEKVKENKPIAKKVVLPEKAKKKEDFDEVDLEEEDFEISPVSDSEMLKEEFKFPMMEDKDFNMEQSSYESEPQIVKIIEDDVKPVRREANYDNYNDYKVKEEKPLYEGKSTKIDYKEPVESKGPYGMSKEDSTTYEHNLYEKKEQQTGFKPSPIISPIYGVLDKNYKKEDVVTKKEVKLTSSYARENLNVDDVRKKAFGTLSDDIALGVEPEEEEPTFEVRDVKENLLVDLSDTLEKPAVHEVTVGDAEEYFQDLGLEYNIDYKDASKDKKVTGRRVRSDEEYSQEDDEKEVKEVKTTKSDTNDDDNDNLFDLIDSMYVDKN